MLFKSALCDWLEKLIPLSQPMRISKGKANSTCMHMFSHTWCQLHVFALGSHWFIGLFMSGFIGQVLVYITWLNLLLYQIIGNNPMHHLFSSFLVSRKIFNILTLFTKISPDHCSSNWFSANTPLQWPFAKIDLLASQGYTTVHFGGDVFGSPYQIASESQIYLKILS